MILKIDEPQTAKIGEDNMSMEVFEKLGLTYWPTFSRQVNKAESANILINMVVTLRAFSLRREETRIERNGAKINLRTFKKLAQK